MLAKLLQLAIYDVQANTHVVLSTIQDGVDGAGGFFYTEEEDTLSIEDDQDYLLSFLCRMDVRLLGNSAKRATLMSMVGKDCVISGLGLDGFFQFGRVTAFTGGSVTAVDTVKLVAVEQVDKSSVFKVIAQKRTTKGYVGGVIAGGVTASENMMAVHHLGAGTASVLYGMFNTGGSASVTTDTLTVSYASLTASAFIGTSGFYLYPFVGREAFFSLLESAQTGTIGTQSLKLLGYNASSVLSTIATTTPVPTGTRTYVGGVIPAGNVFIAGTLEMTNAQAGSGVSIKEPMIGRFTGQRYTKF